MVEGNRAVVPWGLGSLRYLLHERLCLARGLFATMVFHDVSVPESGDVYRFFCGLDGGRVLA